MKDLIIKILHLFLGYETYLKVFSLFKIRTLFFDRRKSDFLFFNKLLNNNATIVVIGACTGITTVPLAKDKRLRKVYAYEPLSSNFRILKQVITTFKLTNVFAFNIGLGNKCERREFILPVIKGVKKQGMAHIKDNSIKEYNSGISETCEIDLLSKRDELAKVRIDGIKMVAENYELEILKGAQKIIQRDRPIIYCELWDNENRKPVLALIQSFGYQIHYRSNEKLVAYDFKNYSGKHFFFIPANE